MQLQSLSGTDNYVTNTIYDPAGRMTSRALGNSLTQTWDYYGWDDKLTVNGSVIGQGGRLKSLTTGTLQNLTYQYDPVGNITQIQDVTIGEIQTFAYDPLDRLTSANVVSGPAPYSETYGYNANTGNLASKAGINYTYDTVHKHAVAGLSNGNSYGYDQNGSQTTRVINGQTFTLDYDAENHLVSVTGTNLSATFDYDGDGKRVKSVINGETTLFVGSHYEKILNGAVTKYYFAGTSMIALRKDGTLGFVLSDHLGSTSITTDASGNLVSQLRYKAWGEVRYSSGTTPTKYTYTGQYSNVADFGLQFYNARWFDNSLGRFTQADTIVPEQSQGTQAWDRYAGMNNLDF